jgi:hypothetical protein
MVHAINFPAPPLPMTRFSYFSMLGMVELLERKNLGEYQLSVHVRRPMGHQV